MKLKDLPGDTKLSDVKVILSDKLYESMTQFGEIEDPDKGDNPKEVYIVGDLMGDYFVSYSPVCNNRRIHPLMYEFLTIDDILNLEICNS